MTKPPQKIANIERREREFLTPDEIDQLISAAKKQGRHAHRDATMGANQQTALKSRSIFLIFC